MGHALKHHVLPRRLEFQGSDAANDTQWKEGRNVALQLNTTATRIEVAPSTEILSVARPCCPAGGYRALSALWGFVRFAVFNEKPVFCLFLLLIRAGCAEGDN